MKAGLYEWADDAACAGWDDAVFFPEPGRSVALARHICGTCTAQAKCLREALTYEKTTPRGGRYGVFGGLTPAERAALSVTTTSTSSARPRST